MLVVDPLPLVQLSLQAAEGLPTGQPDEPEGLLGLQPPPRPASPPAGGAAAAAGSAAAGVPVLRLLQGQVYAGQLTVTNRGKVPVGWGTVTIRWAHFAVEGGWVVSVVPFALEGGPSPPSLRFLPLL